MALLKLLFSILLLSLVYSAPVDLPTETTDRVKDSAITISDAENDAKSPTKTDDLTSSLVLTSSPAEQSDLSVENNEGESLKSNDPVPTDAAKEQTTSRPSSDAILLESHTDPIYPESEKEQQKESENIPKESIPEVDSPTSDSSQAEDIKPLDDNKPTFDQKPEEIPLADSKPNPSVLEDTNIPLEVADRDGPLSNAEPPQEPYDDRPLDITPESFNEEATGDEANNPQTPFDAESANEEKVVDQPFEFPPEDAVREITPEIIQTDATEIQNEPQNTEQINNDGSDPSQLEDKEPFEIAQPEDVGVLESTDESVVDARPPTLDQSDITDEQENNNPGPSFPMTVEEMVDGPVELPMREEPEPPAILVRDDLAPPMLSVIQMEQQPPQFGTEDVVPLSDDSTKDETPEEEVSNSQEMLSFDNRPEQSGPMNIL